MKVQSDAWKDFKKRVLDPRGLDEETMWLLETVFFSGGKAMYGLMLAAADQSEGVAEADMAALDLDLERFYERMKERSRREIAELEPAGEG